MLDYLCHKVYLKLKVVFSFINTGFDRCLKGVMGLMILDRQINPSPYHCSYYEAEEDKTWSSWISQKALGLFDPVIHNNHVFMKAVKLNTLSVI